MRPATTPPKTLNNALAVLAAALNGAVADHLLPLNPAAGVERLPLGDWLRLHEIAPYLDACAPVYKPLGAPDRLGHADQRGARPAVG
jgi:hypothetical protein